MKNIKIIAVDLDDTLLKEDLSISDYTVDILRKAAQKGIYIVQFFLT
jgi:hydroxymethylpyrimidine pyrophosphatase-like HAD family hydrolase